MLCAGLRDRRPGSVFRRLLAGLADESSPPPPVLERPPVTAAAIGPDDQLLDFGQQQDPAPTTRNITLVYDAAAQFTLS